MKKNNQKTRDFSLDQFGRLVIEDKRLLKVISGGGSEKKSLSYGNSDGNISAHLLDNHCTTHNSHCV